MKNNNSEAYKIHILKGKKIKFLLFLLFLFSQTLNSQWITKYSGHKDGDNAFENARGTAVSVDNGGYCYVTGFSDEYNGEGKNILLIKYEASDGDTAWVKTFNGTANGDDIGYKVAADYNQNIYVAGTVSNSAGYYEMVLLKYAPDGSLIWARPFHIDSLRSDGKAVGLVIDNSNNTYITGYCTNSDSVSVIVTIKYDPDGNVVWSNTNPSPDNLGAEGTAVKLSKDGSKVYVLGFINTLASQSDIVLIGYNTNSGTQAFLTTYSGTGNGEDKAFGIAVDETDNIYITGYTLSSNSGTIDCLTIKFTSSGDTLWTRIYNGTGNGEDKAFGIAVDEDGNIYITGTTTTEYDSKDYLIIGYTSLGDFIWTDPKTYNGSADGNDVASAIGIVKNEDSTESIIITGSSVNTINEDYATVTIDAATGETQNVDIYSMNSFTDDIAKDIAIDSGNNAYITGFSQLLSNSPVVQASVSTLKLKYHKNSSHTQKSISPSGFRLSQNYPNPFNPSTTIKFEIPVSSNVKLTVYDILGRQVTVLTDQYLKAGSYNMQFTFSNLASGIYLYELRAGNFRDVKKMSLIK